MFICYPLLPLPLLRYIDTIIIYIEINYIYYTIHLLISINGANFIFLYAFISQITICVLIENEENAKDFDV